MVSTLKVMPLWQAERKFRVGTGRDRRSQQRSAGISLVGELLLCIS